MNKEVKGRVLIFNTSKMLDMMISGETLESFVRQGFVYAAIVSPAPYDRSRSIDLYTRGRDEIEVQVHVVEHIGSSVESYTTSTPDFSMNACVLLDAEALETFKRYDSHDDMQHFHIKELK